MAAKQSQPKPKHIPQRTCIACRRHDAKRGLIRVVRSADGRVALDPTSRLAGRGAYLCHDPHCWEQALKRRAIERALRLESLDPIDRATLSQFAAELSPSPPPHSDSTTLPEEGVPERREPADAPPGVRRQQEGPRVRKD
ncbi:MAG: RNase P modulator RnpM [Oscillochloridaceae bacterium umkhey_bin13]